MIIKDFFQKDINRNIETVIKADDRTNISDEVAEYVITNEISKKIRDFFQAYNNYSNANGVWISGFFGSGKSHLLKILSYVLENQDCGNYKSGQLFAEKIEDDTLLKADILAATRIPSESVLFNIDQQAQITSKSDENAILSVFYKVFYDHLGYYGFQPHVAEFEMWLDKQGKYADFKTEFNQRKGDTWENARTDYFDPLVTDTIAEILGEFNKTDAAKYKRILDEIEDRHKQSIEDFCQRVLDYVNMKPKGFRLNFFVDEVGQYISDNTKLMLNLQTIAETLATKTRGASWILVTSQEDMEKIVGDMNRSQQNDFSRIQARFKIKIPLTSANVDEVIEKRLLKKNTDAQKHLAGVFTAEKAHLETLLSFSEVGVQFRGYKHENDFANKIPFIPYQFDLFQQCRRALSAHNAFQGKHASVGERSMLGVFQQVIRSIENRSDKHIVSFDLMFDGIRNELKGEIQSSLFLAERQIDNPFAIKVLKALFLVKYYSNFKTTKRNISVLMMDVIDIDLKKHETDIETALNLLEHQSYVQRNGDVYEFLTDDEKDVEQEIKNTDIDEQKVTDLLRTIFFDELIKDSKIKYLDNKQDYEFTSKIDGSISGREKELEIEIITESSPMFGNEAFIKAQTMGTSGLKMVLPSNALFMKDLRMHLRTDKYVKQTQSTSNKVEVKRILQEKAQLNAERRRNLIILANEILAKADVYINGSKLELNATADAKTRVINAFQELVKTVYSNLRMLGVGVFSEDSIKNVVRSNQDELFKTTGADLTEAENEVLMLLNRRKGMSERTSLQDLRTHFSKRPYGWYQNAIWTLTAKLYKRGKIELRRDANTLEREDVTTALLNSAYHTTTLLEIQQVIDPQLVKKLKEVYKDFFDETCAVNEAKEVALAFKAKLRETQQELAQLLARKNEFPFIVSLDDVSSKIGRLAQKEYGFFINNIREFEDELLDAKEDLIDPIRRFINSEQASIYESIRTLVVGNTSNFDYVAGNELDNLRGLLKHPKPYSGNLIKEAKEAKESLFEKVKAKLSEESEKTKTAINEAIADLKQKEEYQLLSDAHQKQILLPFETELNKLKDQRYIANLRDVRKSIVERLKPQQLNEMMRLSQPPTAPPTPSSSGNPTPTVATEPIQHYISRNNVRVSFSKTELRTETDVEEYINALKKAYLDQIKDNRRISL